MILAQSLKRPSVSPRTQAFLMSHGMWTNKAWPLAGGLFQVAPNFAVSECSFCLILSVSPFL